MDLKKLFSLQASYVNLEVYQDEFQTMRLLFDSIPEKTRQFVRELSIQWLKDLEQNESLEFDFKENVDKIKESDCFRQEGNRLFSEKGCKRNILGACRLYNDAIYAALDTKGNELAFAFANRGAALQAFGYFQQAYDDCVCALKFGYPESLRHKIILRQAYCSIKLKDWVKAGRHIGTLQAITLNDGFAKEFKQLLIDFEEPQNKIIYEDNYNLCEEIAHSRETQEIVTTCNGRRMQAKFTIEQNRIIFKERASAFVAVADTPRLCHQCGTVNFIPIPCIQCRGRVNYCSLKCQQEHSGIHMYECPAYRMQLFSKVGVAHLALRIMLDDGLSSIIDDLQLESSSCTIDVWRKLTEDGDVLQNNNIQYSESLRMITHLNKMSFSEIQWFALVSYQLVVYLKCYTKYFEFLNNTHENIDWELLTSSLILRHIGQCISNGHVLTTIIPLPVTPLTTTDFHMLNENIWSSPWHVKLGFLHFFSNYDDVASSNLPYLSLCNHSCIQLFQTKFSGRFISTYALRDIKQGEEITNCYDVDYRKSKRETRRKRLQETYHFDCQCEDCRNTDNEDLEFNKFYQYRCDNMKCRKIFTSSTSEIYTHDLQKVNTNLICTICGQKQELRWLPNNLYVMYGFTKPEIRRCLYQIFKVSEQYLIKLNKARCILAQNLVQEWFYLFQINVPPSDQDYCEVIEVIKYILKVTRKRSSVNSTEYVIYMLYLWDLMAKRKYKCSKEEMDEMLRALSCVADDTKLIFLNYYNDYIKEYLNF